MQQQDFNTGQQFTTPQPVMQTQPKKKSNVGKILGIGCLVVLILGIIFAAIMWWGGKKALGMGIELTLKEIRTEVMDNLERDTPEWDEVKYEMDMIILLAKQKKVSLMDFVEISDKYEGLKADGEIDRTDAEDLIDMVKDFNDLHAVE